VSSELSRRLPPQLESARVYTYFEAGLCKDLVQSGIDASLEALRTELQYDAAWKHELQSNEERVLLVDKQCVDANDSVADSTNMDRGACMQEMPNNCNGIAMKLRGNKWSRPCRSFVGTWRKSWCLVGVVLAQKFHLHFRRSQHLPEQNRAVQICEALALALVRIPEPVRQADLYGRRLLRRNKK
jgi:hypothetical protein